MPKYGLLLNVRTGQQLADVVWSSSYSLTTADMVSIDVLALTAGWCSEQATVPELLFDHCALPDEKRQKDSYLINLPAMASPLSSAQILERSRRLIHDFGSKLLVGVPRLGPCTNTDDRKGASQLGNCARNSSASTRPISSVPLRVDKA